MVATLYRTTTSEQGTFGVLSAGDFVCRVLELPWRDNETSVSCIPVGEYEVRLVESRKYGKVYWVRDVPNRAGILIHGGNYAGNRDEGLLTHSEGCILVGKYKGVLGGQRAVLFSKPTLNKFMKYMDGQPFTLRVTGD